MPQSEGMGRMIQMITALSEMQDRRKRLVLDQQQLDQQKEQFGQQLGFQEKNAQTASAFKLIDLASKGGAEGVAALYQLGKTMGLSEEQAQQISHVGMDAGAALQRVQANQGRFNLEQQQAGSASMTEPQRTATQQEAFNTSQTGMNTGQINTGRLIGQMAVNASEQLTPGSANYSQDMADRIGQGFMIQQATRETPQQYSQGQAFINQGLGPAASRIAAGTDPSAGQMLSFQANQADILSRIGIAQATAGQRDLTGATSALSAMHQIAKDLADKKYADKNTMNTMIRQYNAFQALLSSQGVQIAPLSSESDAPSALGRLEIWMRAPMGSQAPSSTPGGGRQAGGRPPGGY